MSDYQSDPFRNLFNDKELSSLFDDEELQPGEGIRDTEVRTCPGCGGNGRYVGLFEIEDPCQECGGTGTVRQRRRHDPQRAAGAR